MRASFEAPAMLSFGGVGGLGGVGLELDPLPVPASPKDDGVEGVVAGLLGLILVVG